MLLFQWNALRAGDRVAVHDDHDPELSLHEGAVRLVRTRQPGANEIGIRLDDPASEIMRPRRHAVHLLPIDPGFPCWRCAGLGTTAPMLDDDPPERRPSTNALSPYTVVLRSTRRQGDAPFTATELVEALAARLGIAIAFDDVGYEAEFAIVAEDDVDAVSTARRRWFYLASDLDLPSWSITHVVVTQSRGPTRKRGDRSCPHQDQRAPRIEGLE